MIIATQLPHARFVMLAGSYMRVCVWYKGHHISYIKLLKKQLKGACFLRMRTPDCVIFY